MRSTMLLTYNINPQSQEDYMRFMINVFIPMLQSIGLASAGVWHTAYGNYPSRLLIFVAGKADMERAIETDVWRDMEGKLKSFVSDYTCRIVPYQPGFQF